jgi:hypothetical protein
MKFYKYWAPGEATVHEKRWTWMLRAYGGSNEGWEAALRRAKEVAERAAAAIERGDVPGSYGYADRALREEIIQEFAGSDGLDAVITRNAYGALVLNTSRVMFVDVDYPQRSLGGVFRSLWNSLRGKSAVAKVARDETILTQIHQVVQSRPSLGLRIYRTAGGYRLLVTSGTYEPQSPDTAELLTAFGSDKLYIRLCKAQECFRARLSAKYWRCGATRPPSRYPWADAAQEAEYRRWENEYHRLANQYGTCAFVGSFGEPHVHDAVQPILETHDRLTVRDGATLA